LVPTTSRPDIVIIQGKDVQLLELTIPINTKDGLQAAHERKQTKPNYFALINDLEAMGFSANLDTLKVGSFGHFEKKAIATLHAILPNFNEKQDLPSPTRTKQDRSGLLLPHLPCKCNLELEHPLIRLFPM